MLETPHVALGAAIATKIPNPLISIPLSFASHFLLEMIPHWNPHLSTEIKKFGKLTKKTTTLIVFDVTTSLVLGSYVAFSSSTSTTHMFTILACCLASALPDLIEVPYFFFEVRNKFLKKWIEFKKSIQVDISMLPGLATQAIVLGATLFWIFWS